MPIHIQLALGACLCIRSSKSRTVGRNECPLSFHVFQRSAAAAELPAAGEPNHEERNYSQGNQQSFEFKWKQPPLHLYKHLSTNLKDPTFRLIPATFPNVTYTHLYFSKFQFCSVPFPMQDKIYGILILEFGCQISVVSILNGLWAGWPINCGSIPGTGKKFSSSQSIQTGSGTNRAFYSVGTMTLFLG